GGGGVSTGTAAAEAPSGGFKAVAEDLPSEAGLDAGGAEDGWFGVVGRAEAIAGGGGVSTGTAAAEAPAGGFKTVAGDLPSEAGLDAGRAEDGWSGAVGRAEAIAGGGGVSTGTLAEAPSGGFKTVAGDLPSEAGLDAGRAEDGWSGAVGRAEAIAGGGGVSTGTLAEAPSGGFKTVA